VQEEICGQPVSLGSFSAMQHVVDPELMAGLLRSLAGEALPRFGDGKDREKIGELTAVDGLGHLTESAESRGQTPPRVQRLAANPGGVHRY